MEAVVLDGGSRYLKAGFAQPDQPPSVVLPTTMTPVSEDEYGGGYFTEMNGSLEEVHPVERGMIKDWDAMEDLWRYALYTGVGWEIGNEGQVLVAEPLLIPKISRERMVQTMFETFNVSGLYAVEQAVLSLYAVGRITGCTVDIGHGKIDIAPVWEGTVQHNAVKRFELGGHDLTTLLSKELDKIEPKVALDYQTVEKLKELHGIVADDQSTFELSMKDCALVEYMLPDGQVIHLGRERYVTGEALFQPQLVGVEDYGIAEQLLRSVTLCSPIENQKQMIENIVLCGGTSALTGLDLRFQREAIMAAPPSVRPTLVKPPEYMPENTLAYSAWMGGAILAKVVFPQNQHISKAEYDEGGPTVVHRKCFL